MPFSRAKFEEINSDLFKRTLGPVKQVLADSKISKEDIHQIVLVGGSTRIPKIQRILSEYFDGRTLNKEINPDEAVAYGAAVQGAVLSGASDQTKVRMNMNHSSRAVISHFHVVTLPISFYSIHPSISVCRTFFC